MPTERPQVLMTAFSCHPHRGSEPGVGYNYVCQLARHCELTVITEALQNRSALEEARRQDPYLQNVEWHFIPWPSVTADGRRNDGVNFARYYHFYRQWQQRALELARSLLESRAYDLTHHLTMVGYREPGYLWRLPVPFVWGPVGGHVAMPWRFFPMLGLRGVRQYGTRNILNALQMRFSPRVRSAACHAAAIFASTFIDRDAIQRFHGRKAILLGEVGTTPAPCQRRRTRESRRALRLAWSGLHIPRKALPILLQALAALPKDIAVEVDILGDGPERRRWEAQARRLGVDQMCRFHGWLPRDQALGVMNAADALVISSLQDASSTVLLEALAMGLPVISHAACGFADVLTEDCGILVPLVSPAASVRSFGSAIARLAQDTELYDRLSRGAVARAEELSWRNRAAIVLENYERIVHRAPVRG